VVTVLPAGGLVAAYGFNEGSGTLTNDVTGNGHTGTLSGATWALGRFEGALSFDGVDDWVTVTDAATLDLTTGMTLEAWLHPTALSGWRSAIMKETTTGLAYALYASDGAVPTGSMSRAGVDYHAQGTAALALNTWTHVAVTYDGATLRLFVNAVERGTLAVSGSLAGSTGPLRIGGNAVWDEHFSGRIDEVRIYNRPLTATEI
jgi:concanavalin A-like lectin/glucanase superfamily protein